MSLKKNIVANYIGNFLAVLVNFLLVPIYLEYLSIEEYGVVTFFSTVTSAFVILDMGLGLTVNKEIASSLAKNETGKETGNIIRTFEAVYWSIAFFIGLILFFTAEIISRNWLNVQEISSETLTVIVSLMGLALIFKWPISFYNNALSGFQKMVNLNIIKSIIYVLNIVGIFILFRFFNLNLKGVFIFLTFIYLFNTSLLIYNLWSFGGLSILKSKFKIKILKKSKKYILSIGFFSIIGTLFVLLDKIVISKFFLISDLGHYSIVSMMTLALLQIVYPVSSAIFPKFVENYTKGEDEKSFQVFRKGYQIVITLLFSISSVLIFFKEEILFLWLQSEFVANESVVYFNSLLYGTIFYSLHVLIISIYTSIGITKPINYLYLCVSFLYIILLTISVFENNILWVSYSWLIVNFILLLGSFYLGVKILGSKRMFHFFINDFILPTLILVLISIFSVFYDLPKLTTLKTIIIIAISIILSFVVYSLTTPYPWRYLKKNK